MPTMSMKCPAHIWVKDICLARLGPVRPRNGYHDSVSVLLPWHPKSLPVILPWSQATGCDLCLSAVSTHGQTKNQCHFSSCVTIHLITIWSSYLTKLNLGIWQQFGASSWMMEVSRPPAQRTHMSFQGLQREESPSAVFGRRLGGNGCRSQRVMTLEQSRSPKRMTANQAATCSPQTASLSISSTIFLTVQGLDRLRPFFLVALQESLSDHPSEPRRPPFLDIRPSTELALTLTIVSVDQFRRRSGSHLVSFSVPISPCLGQAKHMVISLTVVGRLT
ncbi:hypothetical protein V8F33_004422 [Rhypophila sp. PSN 637]